MTSEVIENMQHKKFAPTKEFHTNLLSCFCLCLPHVISFRFFHVSEFDSDAPEPVCAHRLCGPYPK